MDTTTPPEIALDACAGIAAENLEKLGTIIEQELRSWMAYLNSTSATTSYESITSDGNTDADTKVKCLRHILETLPVRHKALINAYNAAETEQVELADQCASFLEQLKVSPQPNTPTADANNHDEKDLNLHGYYDQKLFWGKKFRADVVAQDKEIGKLEAARLEELKELMTMFEELMIVRVEGVLDLVQVQLLVEVMDDVGLSASSVLVGEQREKFRKARVVGSDKDEV